MTEPTAVELATTRLERALQALEAAVEARIDQDQNRGGLTDQIHSLGVDRSRLASELDRATARVRRLEEANRTVADRLDSVERAIRGVIAGEE